MGKMFVAKSSFVLVDGEGKETTYTLKYDYTSQQDYEAMVGGRSFYAFADGSTPSATMIAAAVAVGLRWCKGQKFTPRKAGRMLGTDPRGAMKAHDAITDIVLAFSRQDEDDDSPLRDSDAP